MTQNQIKALEEATQVLINMTNEEFQQALAEVDTGIFQIISEHDYKVGGVLPSCNCTCHQRY